MTTNFASDFVVLMADDDPDDVELMASALALSPYPTDFRHVRDGYELIQYLHRLGRYADAPEPDEPESLEQVGSETDPAPDPDLILLDLNMPRCNGMEVLKELKKTPHLAKIPIVILTTSNAEKDRSQATRLRARGFVTKPQNLSRLLEITQSLDSFRPSVGVDDEY
jgi:two-component system response regulator